MNTKQIVVNGQLLNFYHKEGLLNDGPTLIFLHGWGGDAKQWFDLINKLTEKSSNIFAVDLPGFGKSENPKTPFDIKDYTGVIDGFIKQVANKQLIVVGHSFGGRIAARLASAHLSALQKIVLVNSAGIPTNEERTRFIKIISGFIKPFISERTKTKLYKYVGSDYTLRPDLKETFKKIMTSDIEVYKNIQIPSLIIWGDKDDITPIESAEKMHLLIKGSELFIIKDAGHMSFVDNPEVFIKKLILFIS
ncbi:hypothetical protein COW81_02860 [Candidatus Campbellbacteria bacterium CG22_combo_CG10-13_8_21_14_all_36_13]|uniref:AB hydrolase-1 domain-containing protein n=1 Tax=Candidatus Campbellbacteria bacterium CG22_combo_CG10-13_8_21_14_all_36_13 TaxID=1974529 RepID=A0A2H0DXQ7_9BACT|nr:MAG: hypothetical protein COW81_02860 [Candidatus Campbellbacteria bacterium CG22_combo_CG10-13_8_21_14_all_36_13]